MTVNAQFVYASQVEQKLAKEMRTDLTLIIDSCCEIEVRVIFLTVQDN